MSMSSAITLFLKAAVEYRGIPFAIRKWDRAVSVDDEEILTVSSELINKNKQAYEVLAK